MVLSIICALALAAIPTAFARPTEILYTLELAPGELQVVTETQKWDLKSQGKKFLDVTEFGASSKDVQIAAVTYPSAVAQKTAVNALIPSLSKSNLQSKLTTFTGFNNRYYKSTTGVDSATWLKQQIQSIITAAKPTANVTVVPFVHSFVQNSLIATIPGKSKATVVLGAHQDSINARNPTSGRAPGADDDGSASMEILEAFRVLLSDAKVASGQATNTIEFHWYAAEEGGLLGSQGIFNSYKSAGRNVVAMLNQDETGYVKPGTTESVGLFTDYTDAALTTFTGKVIAAYTKLPAINTQCGYACSDHASARNAGYPTALISEAPFDDTTPYAHGEQDTISTVNFDHLLEMTKISLGWAYELGFATL